MKYSYHIKQILDVEQRTTTFIPNGVDYTTSSFSYLEIIGVSNSFSAGSNSFVGFSNCNKIVSSLSYNAFFINGGRVSLSNCTLSNCGCAMNVSAGSIVYCSSVTGISNTLGYQCDKSIIFKASTCTLTATTLEMKTDGGQIFS